MFIARKTYPASAASIRRNHAALPQAITEFRIMCYIKVLQIERHQLGVQAPRRDQATWPARAPIT